MVAVWESKSPSEIREAIESVIAIPGLSLAEKIFHRYLTAPNHELSQPDLRNEFGPGTLSLQFGTFCRAVAKELGDTQPAPYALTDLDFAPDGTRIRRLKLCVVKAIGGG